MTSIGRFTMGAILLISSWVAIWFVIILAEYVRTLFI